MRGRSLLVRMAASIGVMSLTVPNSLAQEFSVEDPTLRFARADLMLRQKDTPQALAELGSLPKESYSDPNVQNTLSKAFAQLYRGERRRLTSAGTAEPSKRFKAEQKVRVIHRKTDANPRSDQTLDERGLQVNESLKAELPTGRWTHRLDFGVDGFQNGRNDVRLPRRLTYQAADKTLQLTFGDARDYLSTHRTLEFGRPDPIYTGYTIRSAQYRGIDFNWRAKRSDFHVLAGLAPVYLSEQEEYIYPRHIFGIHHSHQLTERYRFGVAFSEVRDSGRISKISSANKSRSTDIVALEQTFQAIPHRWTLNMESAYSDTDDNLAEDRFGNNVKLKDFAHHITSLVTLPRLRWATTYERVEPDFRTPQSLGATGTANSTNLTADRENIISQMTYAPQAPFDINVGLSRTQNNLDDDATIERIRQTRGTFDLGIHTPPAWPRPRLRHNLTYTTSVPGSITRPSQTRLSETELELSRRVWKIDGTVFGTYEVENPLKDKPRFEDEVRWSAGTRLARAIGSRIFAHARYRYSAFNEYFDELIEKGYQHELNTGNSYRLWSTASLSVNSTYRRGKFITPASTQLRHAAGFVSSVGFTWPYTWSSRDKRRKLKIFPAVTYYLTDLDRFLEHRPLVAGRLGVNYEVTPGWKLELMGEYRYDQDKDNTAVRTNESRLWVSCTNRL